MELFSNELKYNNFLDNIVVFEEGELLWIHLASVMLKFGLTPLYGRGVSPNFQPRRILLRLLLCHLNHGRVKESTRKRFIPSVRKDSKVTVVVSILFYLMSTRNIPFISFKRRRHNCVLFETFNLKRYANLPHELNISILKGF